MGLRSLAVLLGASLQATLVLASPVTDDIEIDGLFRTIETNYGPLEYKARQVGLDWTKTKSDYRSRFRAVKSTTEFYLLAARLLGELKDAHVHAQLPSSYETKLPLQLTYVEGKTVVNHLAGSLVRSKLCDVEIGDELVSMDGKSADEIRAELGAVRGLGNARSDQGYLTRTLTARSEKAGIPTPSGDKPKAQLEFLGTNGRTTRCEIPWEVKGYPLVDLTPGPDAAPGRWEDYAREKPVKAFLETLVHLQSQLILLKAPLPLDGMTAKKEDKDAKGLKIDIGHKQPFYPMPKTYHPFKAPGAMQALITLSGLQAGTFLHQGKTVGYLRIPDYVVGHPIFAQFALRYIIYKLEDEAQYLIIDQQNNPGGYVQFSDTLVESLTGKIDPAKHMKFAVRPTQDFIRIYAEILSLLSAATEDDALQIPKDFKEKYIPVLQKEMKKVVAAYEQNKKLSEPIDFYLMSELVTELVDRMILRLISEEYPAISGLLKFAAKTVLGIDPGKKYFYTKPVYMLINELDFSAGDATPATLKDYGRVTLVGVNTAGAGGSVGLFSHHVKNPFKFSLTQSLMVRRGGGFVENVGVAPDIALELTREEIKNGYRGYFERVLKAIDAHRARPLSR
jgi:hypothetical protein